MARDEHPDPEPDAFDFAAGWDPEAAAGPPERTRPRLAAALFFTVWLGLASRRWPVPGLLAEYTGDALYAVAAYWAIALVRPAWPALALMGAAFGASAAVEALQLVHVGWLDDLRATRLGGLLLGHGFQTADLVAYALGAAAAYGLDRLGLTHERGIRAG